MISLQAPKLRKPTADIYLRIDYDYFQHLGLREAGSSSGSSSGGISSIAFDRVNHIYRGEPLGKGRMGIWVYDVFWLRHCSLLVK